MLMADELTWYMCWCSSRREASEKVEFYIKDKVSKSGNWYFHSKSIINSLDDFSDIT